jgi:hypothetical protein
MRASVPGQAIDIVNAMGQHDFVREDWNALDRTRMTAGAAEFTQIADQMLAAARPCLPILSRAASLLGSGPAAGPTSVARMQQSLGTRSHTLATIRGAVPASRWIGAWYLRRA